MAKPGEGRSLGISHGRGPAPSTSRGENGHGPKADLLSCERMPWKDRAVADEKISIRRRASSGFCWNGSTQMSDG